VHFRGVEGGEKGGHDGGGVGDNAIWEVGFREKRQIGRARQGKALLRIVGKGKKGTHPRSEMGKRVGTDLKNNLKGFWSI